MPNDAIIFYRQAALLDNILAGGRIDKVVMPTKDIVCLNIRAKGNNNCLLLSAEPSHSRIQLTSSRLPALSTAPAFLMHLRKHIGNGKILSVESVKYERIVIINILKTDELFDASEKRLIIEVIGKYSNIILVNSDGKISESIKHIPLDATGKRQILPGMNYILPEAQNKPTLAEEQKIYSALSNFDGADLYKYIMNNLAGFSPISIREVIFRVFGSKDYSGKITESTIKRLIEELKNLYDEPTAPYIYYNQDNPIDFSASEYLSLGSEKKLYSSLNEAMDIYFSSNANTKTETNTEKTKLMTEIRHAISKETKKIANFETKKIENKEYEDMRLKGELLTANLYRIPLNVSSIELNNYYTGNNIEIKLDSQKTPQENAQNYYKKYSKMKKTLEMCDIQIQKCNETLESLEQLLLNLTICELSEDLEDVFVEAEKLGFTVKKQNRKKQNTSSEPIKIIIENYEILIGKNSRQNEMITKSAKPDDLWLHTSKIPGSHTIIKNIKGGEIPESVIEKAARHCAYFSKAGNADKVPVDFTFKKYVSKPKDAPIGKFVYTNQKTIFVSPLKP